MTSPFIKFPGGKGYLASTIISYFPKKFGTYFEPMVGGGAVFFELSNRGRLKKACISDINTDLITIYESINFSLPSLVKYLKALRKKHRQIVETEGTYKKLYYAVRKRVNRTKDTVEKSAGLIYLSKTCFNGLFRFNSKGEFNAPMGDQKNPKIFDETNLKEIHDILSKVSILCCDYHNIIKYVKKGDLVYIDPPYWPVRQNSFTSYSINKFDKNDHEQLAEAFALLSKLGVYTVLSNSDTPEVRQLYKGYSITTVQAPRRINSKGNGRGLTKELIIKNYA